MTSRTPSYITRTKHGVFYFQKRIGLGVARLLGIQNLMLRRSLKTKNKTIALKRARHISLKLDRLTFLQRFMKEKDAQNIAPDDLLSFIDEQTEIARQEAIDKARNIDLAIQWEDEYNAIPKWKVHEREAMIEFISPEDYRAMEYVSKEDIDLDRFRTQSDKFSERVVQTEVNSFKSRNSDLLSSLLVKYLAFKERNNVKSKSRNLYRGHIQTFIDVVGDKESNELTYSDVEKFVECLPKIPRNRNKPPFDAFTLDEVLAMRFDESKVLSEGSWNGYATNIRSYLSFYVDKQFIDPLALTAIKGEFTKPNTHPYLEFDFDDLKKLFHSDEYLRGGHKKASNYWCPLIALFTGARSNEICQLTLDDIKSEEVNGQTINYIDINREDEKDTKNTSSIRPVPIHAELVKLGFLDYVNTHKANGEKQLFPDVKLENGVYNRALSRWFRDTYRPSCGVESFRPDKRKVFHSFRHTLVQHLWDVQGHQLEKIGEVIGHTHKTMTGRYIKGLSLGKRAEIIDSIDYGLDFSDFRLWR